jgi:hypothetical protein
MSKPLLNSEVSEFVNKYQVNSEVAEFVNKYHVPNRRMAAPPRPDRIYLWMECHWH